jgi:murein L,D-transpeptidase YafK
MVEIRKAVFHLALHISYPSDEDDKRAAARGVAPGFDIMIHGLQNGRGWIGAFHRWNGLDRRLHRSYR